MPPKEMVSFSNSLTKRILCDCGNLIEYDDIGLNCDFPSYGILVCSGCSRGHRIIVDGIVENLTGATRS